MRRAPRWDASPLLQLALLYLELGTIAFGGPAAHIAMMEDEVVRRRGWLRRDEFLDLVGASSLIPGPSSTEVAIYIGYGRAGVPGLLIAGACFILPAALMAAGLAWAYLRFGALPAVRGLLYGIKPVVIAIVLQALSPLAGAILDGLNVASLALMAVVGWQLGRAALVDVPTVLIAAGGFAVLLWPSVNSAWLVLAGALAGLALGR